MPLLADDKNPDTAGSFKKNYTGSGIQSVYSSSAVLNAETDCSFIKGKC